MRTVDVYKPPRTHRCSHSVHGGFADARRRLLRVARAVATAAAPSGAKYRVTAIRRSLMTNPLASARTPLAEAQTASRREAIRCLSGAALGIAVSSGPVFAQGGAADFSGIAKAAAARFPAIPKW